MTTYQTNLNSIAARCPDRHAAPRATPPQSIEERRADILGRALAAHRLMVSHRAAGDEAEARRYERRGYALKAELAKMEAE
jgi:hypothetical protein